MRKITPGQITPESNHKRRQFKRRFDRYDCLIAVACGMIGAIVDIVFVGLPKDGGILTKWTDAKADELVKSFARLSGWNPRQEKANSVASAIGFLEKKYKVNYDQRHTIDVGGVFNMSARNHHLLSLSHSPDPIGLFFSILNQFTATSSFIADGKLITISASSQELSGHNPITKLYCGIVNWLGHLMSDMAGSSGNRGGSGRGAGIAIPFYELFGFCKIGRFQIGKDRQDLATLATRAFQEGYDARFATAQAIPVLLTELLIRLTWSIRRVFADGLPVKECLPTCKHDDLRKMIFIGNGALCLGDALDASIRSGGNALLFFMRLNLVAWVRFTSMVLKETCRKLGLIDPLQGVIDDFRRINESLEDYLFELEQLDVEAFKTGMEEICEFSKVLSAEIDADELSKVLNGLFERGEIPVTGVSLNDRNGKIVFG